MPITSIGSYGPTTLEFQDDWVQANSELGVSPLLLAGDYNLANFTADRVIMLAAINNVTTLASNARLTSAARDSAKFALLQRHKQLRGGVFGKITNPEYLAQMPVAPKLGADQSKFTDPLKAAALLWTRINTNASVLGLSGPITLAGDYSLAQFQTDITALGNFYDDASSDESALGFARSARNQVLRAIHERMKQFRQVIVSVLPPNSPARQNLPRLSPAQGTKPPSVSVTGAWDATILQARLTWTASTATNLLKLEVRGCPGAYKNSEEEVVADLPGTATEWQGDWALTAPGTFASFKVYVMTTTGNENGGKAIKIVRPAI